MDRNRLSAPDSGPAASLTGPERRYLTIVFTDLCDSTRIAGALDVEDYKELLDALRPIYRDVIGRHGGRIIRTDGDGLTVIFGYPHAHEDQGRRATEAAVDLHDAVRRFEANHPGIGASIRHHTGICSGLVLLSVGDPVLGLYEITGDTTNVASRLAGVAGPDEIIVTEATLGSDRHFFRTDERRLVELRGKDMPVAILRVLGREPPRTRFDTRTRDGLSPFVGRRAELAQLWRCLDDSLAGRGGLAALVGAAGLGKTRLANEFLARAKERGFQIHRGYCEAYLGARTLQPFVQLLRSILGIDAGVTGDAAGEWVEQGLARIAPDLLHQRDLVLRLLSFHGGEGTGRSAPDAEETVALLRDLFAAIARSRQAVLFIDDWQWADDISRRVLGSIRDAADPGIFLLLATREYLGIEARMREADVVELSPFNDRECEAAVGAMLVAVEPFTVARIFEDSGGNPLFIEELCHSRSRGGQERDGKDAVTWLNSLIEARFSLLPSDQAELVKKASVIGHMMPAWLFEEMTGYGENDPAVLDLADRDFIFKGAFAGGLRFKHGLTRDAIYQMVSARTRRDLHRRAAEAFLRRMDSGEEEEPFEALAYHFGAAANSEQAAKYAQLAGDKAFAASSLDRAQAHYRAALASLGRLERSPANDARANILVRNFGNASAVDPSREQLPVLEQALAAATDRGDVGGAAWAELCLAQIYYGLGESRLSIEHCQGASRAANQVADHKLAGHIHATLGQALASACEYDRALPMLDEAIELAILRQPRLQPLLQGVPSC
jgi:class 3 adenylate cyclase